MTSTAELEKDPPPPTTTTNQQPEESPPPLFDQRLIIRINVGGERFSTTLATLTQCPHEKESLLKSIFSEPISQLPKDEKGCVFIDRDSKYFRHILNWLRSAHVPILGDIAREGLLKEAHFFQLNGLIKALNTSHNIPEASLDQLQLVLAISKMKQGFHAVHFSALNMQGLHLIGMELKDGWFYESNLRAAQLCYSTLNSAKFIKAQLQDADFSYADVTSGNFSSANLKGAMFRGTKMNGVIMANADLTGVDLSNQQLSNVNFQGANLTKANLSGANLSYSVFQGAILIQANLAGADLSQANLKSANLTRATFQSAKLCNAILIGSTLQQTNFQQADLTGAKMPESFRKTKSKGLS